MSKRYRSHRRSEPEKEPAPKCAHPAHLVISQDSMDGQTTYFKCKGCGDFWQQPAEFRRRPA